METVTLEIHMPKALYEMVNELGEERNKNWEAIILDSVYMQVLTTMRMEKNNAWKKTDALNKEMQKKRMEEIINTAKNDGLEEVIYPLG